MLDLNRIYHGDCLDVMNGIDDNSIDMILADPPYGTTQCKWDSVIPISPMWVQIKRVIKKNGAIVLTAQTPFDKVLGASNLKMLRYEWIWEKTAATGFLNAKKMPLKAHENALVFYSKLPTYNPQKTAGHSPVHSYTKKDNSDGECYGKTVSVSGGGSTERYPRSVLIFSSDKQKSKLHPTQKPVALMEYFTKTYTNPGELILDFCIGSGTTAIAAIKTGRNFIGIDDDENCVKTSIERITTDL